MWLDESAGFGQNSGMTQSHTHTELGELPRLHGVASSES